MKEDKDNFNNRRINKKKKKDKEFKTRKELNHKLQ